MQLASSLAGCCLEVPSALVRCQATRRPQRNQAAAVEAPTTAPPATNGTSSSQRLGAIEGKQKVGLKMNLPKDRLAEVSALLPSERSPTVSHLVDSHFLAVEVVLDERHARELIPACKRLGATGIFTYNIDVIIH
ncbi:hypothetical protein ABPG75_002017 [Micractinium tetrahymenae]